MQQPHAAAEREGFEPSRHLSAPTRFPVALLRPLGHLSEAGNYSTARDLVIPRRDAGIVRPGYRPVILPADVPTHAQVERLLAAREPSSVSIYLPTDPASSGDAERIELKNLAAEAVRQLRDTGAGRGDAEAIEEDLSDLVEDDELWRHQARSLALFLTPTTGTTFRLANNLEPLVE